MGTAWRYRLFKTGKMPSALKQAAGAGDVVVALEGVSLKVHGRSVRLPGVRYHRSVNLAIGALVVTPRRLLGSVGRWVLVDSALAGAEQAPGVHGAHRVTFADDGVRMFPDLASFFPEGRGEAEFHWDAELAPAQLAQLPSGPSSVTLAGDIGPLLRRCLG